MVSGRSGQSGQSGRSGRSGQSGQSGRSGQSEKNILFVKREFPLDEYNNIVLRIGVPNL